MSRTLMMFLFSASIAATTTLGDEKPDVRSIYDFEVATIDGKDVKLEKYKGDVLLIVNVASQCGLTDRNYKYLEPMHQKYKDQGLRVLAFPANNFGSQEPGSDQDIKKFCTEKYDVSFDMFSKVSVVGDEQCDLYKYLTQQTDESVRGPVKWNFQKYLVSRDGKVIHKFLPSRESHQKEVVAKVEEALKQPKDAEKKGG